MPKLTIHDTVFKTEISEISIIYSCDDTDYTSEAEKFVNFLQGNTSVALYSKILAEMFNREIMDESTLRLTTKEH